MLSPVVGVLENIIKLGLDCAEHIRLLRNRCTWFVEDYWLCILYIHRCRCQKTRPLEADPGSLSDLEPYALGAQGGGLGHDEHLLATLGHLDRLLLAATIIVRVYTLASLVNEL